MIQKWFNIVVTILLVLNIIIWYNSRMYIELSLDLIERVSYVQTLHVDATVSLLKRIEELENEK